MANILHPDFREFLELLNSEKVDYLIVGGYAVSFHGYVRATGDIDIWIKSEPENAARLLKVLAKFGFGGLGLTLANFTAPDQVIQLGYEPVRIDILTSVSGIQFEECFTKRMETELDGIRMPYISLFYLRQNKLATGRPQDLLDLSNLGTSE